jgi:hypothetical protein
MLDPVQQVSGAIAQLGERIVRNDEVAGSRPASSTKTSYIYRSVVVRNNPVSLHRGTSAAQTPLRTTPSTRLRSALHSKDRLRATAVQSQPDAGSCQRSPRTTSCPWAPRVYTNRISYPSPESHPTYRTFCSLDSRSGLSFQPFSRFFQKGDNFSYS